MMNECPRTKRPGRLAPRLIQDILSSSLHDALDDGLQDEADGRLFVPCHKLRQPLVLLGGFSEVSNDQPGHDLLVKPQQTHENGLSDPSSSVSCICVLCRHHFLFHVTPGRRPLGRLEQDGHLLHHYVRTEAREFEDQNVEKSPDFRRYPVVSKLEYRCSVCDHSVIIEMMTPRLPTKWIDLVTDEQRIKDKTVAAKREDPERFEGVKESLQTGALITLNAYLRNLTANGATEPKRILFRNKIYHLQFGDDAKPLFDYLGFTYDRSEDGEEMWVTPVLEPQAKTPLQSSRAFYEDVRSEIQSVIARCGEKLQHTGILVENLPARRVLGRILECGENIYCHSIGADSGDVTDHFSTLGTTQDSDPPLLQWACECQVKVDPVRQRRYLHALEELFKSGRSSRKTETLETYLTTELSKQTPQAARTPLGQALQYFNLSPDCAEADGYIIAVYRTWAEQSPAQKHKHRLMLQQIGSSRKSRQILDVVYNEPMGVREAYDILNADKSYVMSGIAVMAEQVIDNAKTDPQLVLKALETIAEDRPQASSDDAERLEFDHTMSAIRARCEHGNSPRDIQDSTIKFDLPVGLENLRNTCYLNSILQYFFSVNAVRELALRCSTQPALPDTQEEVIDILRRLKLPNLPPGRAFLANHFARELGNLFEELQVSQKKCIKPRQRLANAALMRPFRIRSASDTSTNPKEPKDLPPLPPRLTADATSPKVTMNPVSDASETASDVSSQTLVNQPEDERSYVVIDHRPGKAGGSPVDPDLPEPENNIQPAGKDTSHDSHLTVEELRKELDQPNVGSEQMDIDEVMGNMIDLLEAAEEVSRALDSVGRANNSISQSFFSANVDHRKIMGGRWSTNKRSDRWAVAYPSTSGTRELYDALEPSFGLEQTDTDRLLYLTIESPAPNFHVYIQRTSLVSKNLNLVRIPETLFLDRYMETDEHSTLFSRRNRAWNINARLMQIEEQLGAAVAHESMAAVLGPRDGPPDSPPDTTNDDTEWNMVDIADANSVADCYGLSRVGVTQTNLVTVPGAVDRDSGLEPGSAEAEPDLLSEKNKLMEEKKTLFAQMEHIRYRLHAVLCHVGTSGRAGHYWAWVFDFEQGVWRKYNDTTVTVEDTQHVLRQLNTTDKGEPYYIAYVRDSEVDRLVHVPHRGLDGASRADEHTSLLQDPADVEMAVVRGGVAEECVEDVGMQSPGQV